MRKVLQDVLGATGVVVGLGILLWLIGHANPGRSEITVVGSGTARGAPDISEVRGSISSSDKTAARAQAKNIADTKLLISKILEAGVKEKDLKTARVSLQPDYDYKGGSRVLRGYTASTTLTIKIRDFDKIPAILDLMTANGVGNILGPSLTFGDEKLREIQKEARDEAVKDARERATQLASLSGRRLGGLVAVKEGPEEPWMYDYGFAYAGTYKAEEATPYIQPGENEAKVIIEARYRLR